AQQPGPDHCPGHARARHRGVRQATGSPPRRVDRKGFHQGRVGGSEMIKGTRIGVMALLCTAVWACGRGEASEEEVAIQTVTVSRGNLRKAAEATGSIEPVRKVDVK